MTTKSVLIFSAGCVLGSVVTFYYTKKVITDIAEEEIKSVKEAFRFENKKDASEPDVNETSTIDNYGEFIKNLGYTSYAGEVRESDENEKSESSDIDIEPAVADDANGPVVIAPDDFAENPDLNVSTLTYYSDGILTDEEGNIIGSDFYEDLVGKEFYTHFGENAEDPDSVYILNARMRSYYEILYNYDKYEDLMKNRPDDIKMG